MSLIMLESWDNYRYDSYIHDTVNWGHAYGKWTGQSGSNIYCHDGGRHGYKMRNLANGIGRLDKSLQVEHEHATLIVGTAFYWERGTTPNQVVPFFSFGSDFGATNHLSLSMFTGTGNGSDGYWIIENGLPSGVAPNATSIMAGTLTNTTGILSPGVWRYLEVKVTYGTAGTTGRVTIKVAGTTVYDQAFNTVAAGGTKTVFDFFRFYVHGQDSSQTRTHFDDTYLANGAGTLNNDFLGDIIVEQRVADGQGSSNVWANSAGALQVNNFQYLNGFDPADVNTDYVWSSTNEQTDLYNYQNSGYAAPSTMVAAVINTKASKTDTGPRSIKMIAKNGASTYESPDRALDQGARTWTQAMETQPDGTPWTLAAFNATEFGIRTRP